MCTVHRYGVCAVHRYGVCTVHRYGLRVLLAVLSATLHNFSLISTI